MTGMRSAAASRPATGRRDLYAEVTQKLIAAIEAGPGEPILPWRRTAGAPLWRPVNAITGNAYRGINVVLLWGAAESEVTGDGRLLDSHLWATYRQWQEAGAQVRKGEKSSLIVKYGEYDVEPDPGTEGDDGKRLYLKTYHVFNVRQVDGYAMPPGPAPLDPLQRVASAEAFVANTKAVIVEGGSRAFYSPSTDTIHMPDDRLFTGSATLTREESYAAVMLHEAVHWTSLKGRCERGLGKRFGDDRYAVEELVAEIGAALLCAELRITQDVRADHAQYLTHWLRLLKADSKAIFTAAAAAERAADYLKSLQPAPVAADSPLRPAADTADMNPMTPGEPP